LFKGIEALILIRFELAETAFEGAEAIAVFLGLPNEVRHLPFDCVETLVEGDDRRLGRRRIVREASGVSRAPLREDLALHLLHLFFEAVDALLGTRRRLTLRKRDPRHER
jgi:hypothetical protein